MRDIIFLAFVGPGNWVLPYWDCRTPLEVFRGPRFKGWILALLPSLFGGFRWQTFTGIIAWYMGTLANVAGRLQILLSTRISADVVVRYNSQHLIFFILFCWCSQNNGFHNVDKINTSQLCTLHNLSLKLIRYWFSRFKF